MPPERLVVAAAEMGHDHLALTDVNNLCAAPRFWKLAREAGLRPIIGAEIRAMGGDDTSGPPACSLRRAGLVALVEDDRGYENLCRLLTRVHCDEGFAVFAEAAAGKDAPTAVAGLAEMCQGLCLLVDDAVSAEAMLDAGVEPGQMFLAVDPAAQTDRQLSRLLRLADERGLPIAAAGKALFAAPGDHELARLLAAIRLGRTIDDVPAGETPPRGAYLRSGRELAGRLAAAGLAQAATGNRRIVERCEAFRLLPRPSVFPGFEPPDGSDAPAFLRKLCRDGIARRYGQSDEHIARRLAAELDLIERRGLAEYFLVVWDIVQYARRLSAPVAGRGSGASSLVAYLLGITNVCPLALGIPFERFLNDGRKDFPDLDVDFCWRMRDEVIDYALGRWGLGRAAMVCTHNTFQERSAFREAAKALGLSDEQITRLRPEDDSLDGRLGRAGSLARRLVGLLHNLSVHPGGIVIAPRGIDRHVPVQPSPKGVRITQYDKDGVEDIGLVKLDLLGNRGLSTIRCACDLIAANRGQLVDIERLPPGDPATAMLLRSADTVGCNQIESPAMRHLLLALEPDSVEELMKALALIRPGAASIGMKEQFVRRSRGMSAAPPGSIPAVDAILSQTHGVMLYEDDVMLVAAAMMNTSLAEGDRFRKAVQKCRDDVERLGLSRQFVWRCAANGIDADLAKLTWVQMAKFNAYSFCRAHAASYAMLAYASAYLKAHWPAEFWTSCLNNNQSMYHPRVYVEQAKRAGVRFLLPDVNRSRAEYSMDGGAVRLGLGMIAGLGPGAVEAILDSRRHGDFGSLTDFLARARIGREQARTIVQCGAADALGPSRPGLMMELNMFYSLGPHRASGQAAMLASRPTIPDLPDDYSHTRKYADQRRILGVSVGEHIMALYRPALAEMVDSDSRNLARSVGRHIRIAGVLEARRLCRADSGQTMTFLTLDDEFGLFEATLFPNVHAAAGPLDSYGPYVLDGVVQEQYGSITVTARQVTTRLAGAA
jgi:DNA-directed DNA polymerase III PolC